MRRKIELISDPEIATTAAEVALWTQDGATHALSTRSARGSLSNPMRDDEIADKLRNIAAA